MAIKVDATPFSPEAVIGTMSEQEAEAVARIFGNELMINFLTANRKLVWEALVLLDPVQLEAQDYYDTMVHLKGRMELADTMIAFATRSKDALLAITKPAEH